MTSREKKTLTSLYVQTYSSFRFYAERYVDRNCDLYYLDYHMSLSSFELLSNLFQQLGLSVPDVTSIS